MYSMHIYEDLVHKGGCKYSRSNNDSENICISYVSGTYHIYQGRMEFLMVI